MIFDKLWSFNCLFQRFYYNGRNVQFINFFQVPTYCRNLFQYLDDINKYTDKIKNEGNIAHNF